MEIKKIYPAKLQAGDSIAIIAPSRSFSLLSADTISIANKRFEEMGLSLVFGKNISEMDDFYSSSIESRVHDLMWAFENPKVKAILTVLGGFNSNQLLKYIDWGLIKNNPKIFCGYSDITALSNAIFSKTGLVTYSGPHYSTFGQDLYFDYTLDYFRKCMFSDDPIEIASSEYWSDDAWFLNQKDRNLIRNEGAYAINYGEATGTIVGGNLVTLRNLQGTEYFPSLKNSILFLEDDYEAQSHHFDSSLQSLILSENFKDVKGIVFGRFQVQSQTSKAKFLQMISSKKELKNIPIVADVDFGHTSPTITLPVGGEVYLKSSMSGIEIIIKKH